MAVRLNFIVEGQTEETFVKGTLSPHLADRSIYVNVRCVMTSRKGGLKYSGGIANYAQAKRDIARWMKEDRNPDARFTTMFDLYALPVDFPGFQDARTNQPYQRVQTLEYALGMDIADPRFVPYIQLHEFEALLLSDPSMLDSQFPGYEDEIRNLVKMACGFDSPELIDDGSDTAPSKRIITEIPEYAGRKASAGPIVAGKIGLPTLRSKCDHFGDWLDKLEHLESEVTV